MTLLEKRKIKYPDTDTFHYFNANPKNKITTDCVIRALSAGMQKPYNEIVMDLAKLQCETGIDPSNNKMIDKYLTSHGWTRCKQPRKVNGKKYTGEEFCRKLSHPIYNEELTTLPDYYDCNHIIANIGGHHVVAIINQKVNDIWNSTQGSIGIVWVKKS